MRSSYEEKIAQAREIEGQLLSGRDTLVPPTLFGPVCKLIWPRNTAANLATVGGKDERTAKRWLSSEYDPPIKVALYVIDKIFERVEITKRG